MGAPRNKRRKGKHDAQHQHAECGGGDHGSAGSHQKSYGGALAVTVTTLFFIWGFLTCMNDILIPHLQSIFDLNYFKSMLIQFAFFGSYFIFSIPAAENHRLDWISALNGAGGLLTMESGSIPICAGGPWLPSYPLFLGALIVLAAGNHLFTGCGKPICNRTGQAGNGFQPR